MKYSLDTKNYRGRHANSGSFSKVVIKLLVPLNTIRNGSVTSQCWEPMSPMSTTHCITTSYGRQGSFFRAPEYSKLVLQYGSVVWEQQNIDHSRNSNGLKESSYVLQAINYKWTLLLHYHTIPDLLLILLNLPSLCDDGHSHIT